LQEKKMLGKRS